MPPPAVKHSAPPWPGTHSALPFLQSCRAPARMGPARRVEHLCCETEGSPARVRRPLASTCASTSGGVVPVPTGPLPAAWSEAREVRWLAAVDDPGSLHALLQHRKVEARSCPSAQLTQPTPRIVEGGCGWHVVGACMLAWRLAAGGCCCCWRGLRASWV